jgi:hypothetical protein
VDIAKIFVIDILRTPAERRFDLTLIANRNIEGDWRAEGNEMELAKQ